MAEDSTKARSLTRTDDQTHLIRFTATQIQLLKDTICRGATDDEMHLFALVCERTGLDPFAGQIHAVKRWDSTLQRNVMAIQAGIDGYRLIAQRSREYEGQTPPAWCDDGGKWVDVWLSPDPPFAARVGVYRAGAREPFIGIARYSAYVQRKKDGDPNSMWDRMDAEQLAKCAEALALRKGFPRELSGIYSDIEMEQAGPDNQRTVKMPSRKSDVPQAPAVNEWRGFLTGVTEKAGKTQEKRDKDGKAIAARPWTAYTLHGEDFAASTFDTKKRDEAKNSIDGGAEVIVTWDQKGEYKNVVSIRYAGEREAGE